MADFKGFTIYKNFNVKAKPDSIRKKRFLDFSFKTFFVFKR